MHRLRQVAEHWWKMSRVLRWGEIVSRYGRLTFGSVELAVFLAGLQCFADVFIEGGLASITEVVVCSDVLLDGLAAGALQVSMAIFQSSLRGSNQQDIVGILTCYHYAP